MNWLAMMFAAAIAPAALGDPAQEARALALEREIRCVQCENEPIAQSTAEIAGDMRALVRERIAAGDSDGEIRSFFRARYGDFVLFRPPLDGRTLLLWLAPLLLAGAGVWAMFRLRAGQGAPAEGAEEDER
ncbi:MAG TPA: cytochrome c-type biogenesis protein CcmH [Terricaulis sp.]|nr:cytochrome c-type biogenesis protein CcmH [Terricaulis sp.]